MAEIQTPAAVPLPMPPPPPPRKRRWGRRLLLASAAVVVGLALLVALAPTLLGTRPVVSFALGQVNKRLNGRVEVASVSLGWLSGVRVDGVRVFDAANAQIAQVEHVACPIPLWRAATGRYPLGDTVVDGLAFDAKVDGQGRLNFAQLVNTQTSAPPAAPAAAAPPTPASPSKLPDLSGDVQLKNCRGTVSQVGKPTVYLTHLAGEVKIPGINDPITDHLDAAVRVGAGGAEGHLVADGTAAAIKANRLDLDTANVHQTADVTGLDLAAAKPFVPASVGLDTLSGLLDGHLSADVTNGKAVGIDATLAAATPVAIGGRAIKGDTFTTATLAGAIPKLSAAFPDGLAHWQTGRVTVGAEPGSRPMSFKVDQGQLTLLVDLPVQGLLNLAAGKPPGAAGALEFADHFDAGKIVGQRKNSAHLSDQAALTGGTLDQSVKLAMTPDRGTVTASTDLTGVTGTRNGQPVVIQPVHLKLAAADVGGTPLDGLRDLSLTLSSKSANADFHGTTVGDLTGTLTARLESLQAEAAQLVDFGDAKLAGDVAIHLADHGQLMQAPYQAQVKADVSATNLRYADKTGPRVAEPLVQFAVTGDLHGSERSAVEQIKDLLLTLKAGTAESPTVDVAVSVPSATVNPTPSADFRVTRCNVNLQQLQQQFAPVPAGRDGVVCAGGMATANASGHYGPDGLRLDPSYLSIVSLFLQKQLATGQRINAISGDTVNLAVAGTVGLGDTTTVGLTTLSVADAGHILDIHKGDGDLTLTKTHDGVAGHGTLAVMVELGSVNDILSLLTQETVTAQVPAGRVKMGHLSGTLAFTTAASGRTDVVGRFDVPNLDVATPTGGPGPQKASVVVRASSDPSIHMLVADELSFTSPFATAAVSNLSVLLTAPSTVHQLQKATLAVDVPDLKTLMALANSFSTPAAAPAPPPVAVTAGTFSLRADVSHDGNNLVLSVPTLTANNLAFTRGTASYRSKPVSLKLAARVGTAEGPTLVKQLRGLTVTQLDGTVGVATVSMPTPITVADLSNPAATAAGGIKADGELADIAQLAAAFGGKPADAYPYRGHLTVVENVAAGPTAVALQGSVQVSKFQVMKGPTAQFAEDLLSVTNDVAVPPDLSAIGIRNLAVDMRSSRALNVTIANGRIDDPTHARRLRLPVQVQYDLAKLWPIVHPMLLTPGQPDGYADVKLAGAFTKSLTVGGAYPAGAPMTAAIKVLTVDADLAVADFEHAGLIVKDLDVPVTLRDGRAVTTYPDGHAAPVATANDGQLDLGHFTIDLTQDPPRVSTPANKPVLTHATINPLFADSWLNKFINNPLFVGDNQASGLVDVALVQCDRLPAGILAQEAVPANDGSATVKLSLTNLSVGSPKIGVLLGVLLKQDGSAQPDSFTSNVKDGTVRLARGVATEDLTFQTGQYRVPFKGDVILATQAFHNFTVGFPGAAVARQAGVPSQFVGAFPATIPVPINGTIASPQPDIAGAAALEMKRIGRNPGQLIGGLLNGGKGNAGGSSDNPIGDLLGAFGKKRNK